MRFLIEILVIIFIGAFAIPLFSFSRSEHIVAYFAAFSGAYFSFMLGRLSIRIDKVIERVKLHYNALAYIERYFILTKPTMNWNIQCINGYIRSLSENKHISPSFSPLRIDYSVLNHLRNLSLLNDFSQLINSMEQLNQRLESVYKDYNSLYEFIKFDIQISATDKYFEKYQTEITSLAKLHINNFSNLLILMRDLDKSLIENTAKCKIALQNKSPLSLLDNFLSFNSSFEVGLPNNFENTVAEKIEELKK